MSVPFNTQKIGDEILHCSLSLFEKFTVAATTPSVKSLTERTTSCTEQPERQRENRAKLFHCTFVVVSRARKMNQTICHETTRHLKLWRRFCCYYFDGFAHAQSENEKILSWIFR